MVQTGELHGTTKKQLSFLDRYLRVEYDISVSYCINQENDHTRHQ